MSLLKCMWILKHCLKVKTSVNVEAMSMLLQVPKLGATAESFLLAFPTSYMVEARFSHVNVIFTKQRNSLNLLNHGDLRLTLTNFQPNVNNLAAAHQAHPSH